MEATKNITAKEREFIAAVEAHRNAEGKVIAWDICANGNGKVIFENATKDRYSCAHVIDMEGGYFLLFVGERAGHPYDRKTYKRKGNALKGFKMQEGHNEPPTFAATPTETPQISTEAAETVNVSEEGENEAEAQEIGRKPDGREAVCRLAPAWAAKKTLKYGYKFYCFNLYPNGEFSISVENRNGCRILTKDEFRELCTDPPQSPETPQTAECITDTPEPRETARKRLNRAIGSAQTTRRDTLRNTLRSATYVPRECSTVDAAHW